VGEPNKTLAPNLEEYLTIEELAARLKLRTKTIKNKMANGTFRRGVHYFSPKGLGPRFKWSAVVAWLEEREQIEKTPHTGRDRDPDGPWLLYGFRLPLRKNFTPSLTRDTSRRID